VTATLLLPHDAPREEWLDRRREGVTASEIATILGISPWDSAFNLYWRKLGEIPEDFDNTAMSLGRHLEPWIADRWAEDHPEFVIAETGLWRHDERTWQMATPDRYLLDRHSEERDHDAPLEIKSAGSYDGWGDEGTDQIPAYYRAQVLWQLDTLGLSKAHVTCWFKQADRRRDYVAAYDIRDVDLMRQAALEFLDQLADRTPPPVDGHKATLAALKQLHPKVEDREVEVPIRLALDYEAACTNLRVAQLDKAELENRLRDLMGDAKYAYCAGQKVATRAVYDVSQYTVQGFHVDKLIHPNAPKDPS
jgi:putative phage-type endonuclease